MMEWRGPRCTAYHGNAANRRRVGVGKHIQNQPIHQFAIAHC